jgi:exopolyphosphatase / guanosine-5'-triphosphate,3'-diphosphate pyrophosphatase
MSVCVIDVGSSTVRILTADRICGTTDVRILQDMGCVTRLAEGMKTDMNLLEPACRRTLNCIRDLLADLTEIPESGVCIATHAVRTAQNGREFADRVAAASGFPVEILSQQREAELAWMGSAPTNEEETPIIDFGGGSTELIQMTEAGVMETESFPFGAGTLLEEMNMDLPLDPNSVRRASEIASLLVNPSIRKYRGKDRIHPLILGGTATTAVAGIHEIHRYAPGCVHGKKVTLSSVEQFTGKLAELHYHDRETIFGIEPGRGSLILSGVILLAAVLKSLGCEGFTVSEHGIRFGRIREMFQ